MHAKSKGTFGHKTKVIGKEKKIICFLSLFVQQSRKRNENTTGKVVT